LWFSFLITCGLRDLPEKHSSSRTKCDWYMHAFCGKMSLKKADTNYLPGKSEDLLLWQS